MNTCIHALITNYCSIFVSHRWYTSKKRENEVLPRNKHNISDESVHYRPALTTRFYAFYILAVCHLLIIILIFNLLCIM